MKRSLFLLGVALAFAQGWHCPNAHAFGGEDPLAPEGPAASNKGARNPAKAWHHEEITEDAAALAGFSDMAADSLAWTADYLDSYLYSPIWWAQNFSSTGINRFKLSMALAPELEGVHFDDLFSGDRVNYAWRRYTAGAFAGLLWASEQKGRDGRLGDVAAGQNVLGASLHAIQDFYSHSNWVDDPARRDVTFFEMPRTQRTAIPLYTGAYEHDDTQGVKHHGKYLYSAAVMLQPGVKQVLEAACSVASPLTPNEMCENFRAAKAGTSVSPNVTPLNIPVPKNILVLAPPGIALDSTWIAAVGVKQRGIDTGPNAMDGPTAYKTAATLATRQSAQWLETLGKAMNKAGKADFWSRITREGVSQADREYAYENYAQFPFTFVSHGTYPPTDTSVKDEWYLRIRLKTANESGAGTDADIKLRVAGAPDTLLDWTPRANPILAHNDFEAGDNEVYIAGPFSSFPNQIELYNDAATGSDTLKALGNGFVNSVTATAQGIRDFFRAILGTNADHIATNKQLWMPSELASLTTSNFSVSLNGGDEGNYTVTGTISKVSEDERNYTVSVRLSTLNCIAESKWDRGSSSDEPFILAALNPLPGDQQKWRCEPFSDVDKGEKRDLNYTFGQVTVPKEFGILNLALSAMESDDESSRARNQALDDFAGRLEASVADEKRDFGTALGTYLAPDWKLENMEVTAWTRNGSGNIRYGQVFNAPVNAWITARRGKTFGLSYAATRDTSVSYLDLLPELPRHSATPAEGTPGATPAPVHDASPVPGVPGPPTPGAPGAGSPSPVTSAPGTSNPMPGTGTTTPDTSAPVSPYGAEKLFGYFWLTLESVKIDRTGNKVEALFNFRNARDAKQTLSISRLDLAVIDAEGVGVAAEPVLYHPTVDSPFPSLPTVEPGASAKARYMFPLKPGTKAFTKLTMEYWAKERVEFDISNLVWPKVSTLTLPSDIKEATSEFHSLGENWDVRFDGWRKGRDGGIEVFATYKNVQEAEGRLTYQTAVVEARDADGLLKEHYGELFRVAGTSVPLPTPGVVIVPPHSEAKVRYRIKPDAGFITTKIVFTEGRYKKDSFEVPITVTP